MGQTSVYKVLFCRAVKKRGVSWAWLRLLSSQGGLQGVRFVLLAHICDILAVPFGYINTTIATLKTAMLELKTLWDK